MKRLEDMTSFEKHDIKRRQHCSPEDYVRVLELQNGKCAICQDTGNPRHSKLRADTFRKDGEISLVCFNCFKTLEIIHKAGDRLIRYLELAGRPKI
jgi:hypothetical protein